MGPHPSEETRRIPVGKHRRVRHKPNVAPSPIEVRSLPRPMPLVLRNLNRFPIVRGNPRTSHAIQVVRATFLQIPARFRRNMKIPVWYPDQFGVPPILLRAKMRSLTTRQRILAMLARMYYIWITDVSPVYEQVHLSFSDRLRVSHCDGISNLLWQAFRTKYWYGPAARLHGKLKVLLSPSSGW